MRTITTLKKIYGRLLPLFEFDVRSLSFMRIALGFTLLTDLLVRVTNIQAHYSDYGVLPLEALHRLAWNQHFFSLYSMTGSPYLQALLFAINFICILCFTAGYRTRFFNIASWLFLISLHNRNPYIHQGGDDLMRLIMFWGIFLPWNARYSIDSSTGRASKPLSPVVVSLAAFAYMLQVGYVYFFSAMLKSSPEWRSEYSALYYALSLDQIVLPAGRLIYPYEGLLKAITFIVFYIEGVLPFVLLIPVFTKFFRLVFVVTILCLHLGISLTLNVGLFPMIGIASLIGLLPGNIVKYIVESLSPLVPGYLKMVAGNKMEVLRALSPSQPGGPYREGFRTRGVIALCAAYVLTWNFLTLGRQTWIDDLQLRWVGYISRLDQHWGMFSPGVFKDDGWFIFEAQKSGGGSIDILRGREVTYKKLSAVSKPFTEDRWRKFSENILFVVNGELRIYYCSYLMNDWNRKQNKEKNKIKSLRIIYMKEVSLPAYKIEGPVKEVLCECSSGK